MVVYVGGVVVGFCSLIFFIRKLISVAISNNVGCGGSDERWAVAR